MPIAPYDLNDLAAVVVDVYDEAENDLIRRIARLTAKGIGRPDWLDDLLTRTGEARSEAAAVVRALSGLSDDALRQALGQAYLLGRTTALEDAGVKTAARPASQGLIDKLIRPGQKIQKAMGLRIQSTAPKLIANITTRVAAQLSTGTQTRVAAAARAIELMANDGIDGFVDKKGRKWEIQTYAEMSTRTMASQAGLASFAAELKDLGHDLVIISDVKEECERCRPYEGKVLCTSDRPTKYPTYKSAIAEGLQHPNCRHTASIYIEGITKAPVHQTGDPEGAKLRARQRELERRVRKAKQAALGIAELNDPVQTRIANQKVTQRLADLKTFNTENNRKQGKGRTSLRVR